MQTRITSEILGKLFKPSDSDEIVIWGEDPHYVGFSVLREYDSNTGFIPTVTKSGVVDTRALIKFGVRIPENSDADQEIQIILSASKYGTYESTHHGIDFTHEDAPTKASLAESAKSQQPISLDDRTSYTMVSNGDGKFTFFKKNKAVVTVNEIIDDMFQLHQQTISGRKATVLKVKLSIRKAICSRHIPQSISFFKVLLSIFGKEIQESKDDYLLGIFGTYSFSQNIDTKFPNSVPFFSSETRISLRNIFWISLTVLVSRFTLFDSNEMDGIYGVAFIVLLIGFFEYMVPFSILHCINGLIKFRIFLERRNFTFK